MPSRGPDLENKVSCIVYTITKISCLKAQGQIISKFFMA